MTLYVQDHSHGATDSNVLFLMLMWSYWPSWGLLTFMGGYWHSHDFTLILHKQTLVWAFQFLPVQMLLDSKCKCLIDANDNNSSVLSHTSLWNHHIEAYSVVYYSGHIPFSLPVYLDCTGIRHFILHSFH